MEINIWPIATVLVWDWKAFVTHFELVLFLNFQIKNTDLFARERDCISWLLPKWCWSAEERQGEYKNLKFLGPTWVAGAQPLGHFLMLSPSISRDWSRSGAAKAWGSIHMGWHHLRWWRTLRNTMPAPKWSSVIRSTFISCYFALR